MIKSRNDYKCKLIGRDGTELMKFNACAMGDLTEAVSFVGGGIASAGQALSIWTEKAFLYKPHEHSVVIGDTTYKLTSFVRGMRKKMGASCTERIAPIYVLNLE